MQRLSFHSLQAAKKAKKEARKEALKQAEAAKKQEEEVRIDMLDIRCPSSVSQNSNACDQKPSIASANADLHGFCHHCMQFTAA